MRDITPDDLDEYAPKMVLTRHIGLITAFSDQELVYRGDPEDLKKELISVNAKNFLTGWWSISSLFSNPVHMVANLFAYLSYKKRYAEYVANPEEYIENEIVNTEKNLGKTSKATIGFYILTGIIISLCIFVIIAAM